MKMNGFVMMVLGSVLIGALAAQVPPPPSRVPELEAALKANPNDPKLMAELGLLYFGQAAGGDKDAVDKAADVFERLIQQDPKNAEYHSRYGSILAMKGRDAWFPLEKMRQVNNGLEEMGKAVNLAPDNVAVRLTRANTCYALPEIFNRVDTAITDCRHLCGLFEKNPGAYPESVRMQTRILLGASLKKSGKPEEAKNVLNQIVADAPTSPYAEKAKKLLAND